MTGGRERTEPQLGRLLNAANFSSWNCIDTDGPLHIIEAFAPPQTGPR